VQDYLGTTFLQGLDKLIVYNVVSELRKFCRNYGLLVGGGGISEEKRTKGGKQSKMMMAEIAKFDVEISENFGSLNPNHYKRYSDLLKLIQPLIGVF